MRTGTCERCGDPFEDRSHAQKRRFCSDNCRKRHCDETTLRGVCVACGGPMGARTRGLYTRCEACHLEHIGALRRLRRERIAERWNAGVGASVIAAELGSTTISIHSEISYMRADGWVLEIRRPDCQGDHMAPAIAARWAA